MKIWKNLVAKATSTTRDFPVSGNGTTNYPKDSHKEFCKRCEKETPTIKCPTGCNL